jgi:uncharacterized membrane protein
MSKPAHMLAATYPDREHARTILDMLESMRRGQRIKLVDAAMATKDSEGKLQIEETQELTGRKGATRGALIMGSVALFFPPSIIAGALAGGAVGAIAGRFHDSGVKNKQLHDLAARLEPGQALIIALTEEESVAVVESALTGYDGTLVIAEIDAETLDKMHRQAVIEAGSQG